MTKEKEIPEELVEEIREFGRSDDGLPSREWAMGLIAFIGHAYAKGELELPNEAGRGRVKVGLIREETFGMPQGDWDCIALRREEANDGQ